MSVMPGTPTPIMSGSFQAPMPVPGRPGAAGGVEECATVWSKLLRMLAHAMEPGAQTARGGGGGGLV